MTVYDETETCRTTGYTSRNAAGQSFVCTFKVPGGEGPLWVWCHVKYRVDDNEPSIESIEEWLAYYSPDEDGEEIGRVVAESDCTARGAFHLFIEGQIWLKVQEELEEEA